jgi:hypothetical protein
MTLALTFVSVHGQYLISNRSTYLAATIGVSALGIHGGFTRRASRSSQLICVTDAASISHGRDKTTSITQKNTPNTSMI